jgi:hypothetical protein
MYVSDWEYNRLALEEAIHTSALLNQKSRSRRWKVREKHKGIHKSLFCTSWEDDSKITELMSRCRLFLV